MKTIEIKGSLRTELGKKSTKVIRKTGNVPCVIYVKEKNIHFHTHENNFKNLIYTPEAHLVKIILEDREYQAALKDIQFHPVKDNIIHVDFVEVFEDKPVTINIPIKISGVSVGVLAGGKLMVKKRNLKVKGLPGDLPEFLPVDITDVKIHGSIKVGDLAYEKIELLDPKKLMVLTVATARGAQKGEGGAAAETAAPATATAE